jgi:hypothetical protein
VDPGASRDRDKPGSGAGTPLPLGPGPAPSTPSRPWLEEALRKDDLLWKPGFESWKPVRSVCDLGATSNSARAQQEATQDADDLTSDVTEAAIAEPAANAMQAPKPSLKTRLYDELRKFLAIFAYLWLVFSVFLLHEWAVLAGHQISFKFYGLAVVNALILAKTMLIAEAFGFADRPTTSH